MPPRMTNVRLGRGLGLVAVIVAALAAPSLAQAGVYQGSTNFNAPTQPPSLVPEPPITEQSAYYESTGAAYDSASKVTTHTPSAAQARELADAMARAGFPTATWKLGHTAVSANPSGYAITTPIARNPADQGNGVVIFAETHGRWRVVTQGSSFRGSVPGIPSQVLKALLSVPNEGSVPAAPDTTPKTGPLSTAPKITAPAGPAPKTLVKTDLITGTGAVAAAGDTITVNYVLALYNGKVIQSSFSSEPFSTPLVGGSGGVIPGWVKGLVGMRVGGRRELIIPPSLAYKNQANGTIPANATLIFVVDLLAVTG